MTFRDGVILRQKNHSSELHLYDHLSEAYSRAIAAYFFLFDCKLGNSKANCALLCCQKSTVFEIKLT